MRETGRARERYDDDDHLDVDHHHIHEDDDVHNDDCQTGGSIGR